MSTSLACAESVLARKSRQSDATNVAFLTVTRTVDVIRMASYSSGFQIAMLHQKRVPFAFAE
jgi:hypothetical protein